MNVKIGAEAALFPDKEYISGIFVAVWPGAQCELLITVMVKQRRLCIGVPVPPWYWP
jgi:hypothetical protein